MRFNNAIVKLPSCYTTFWFFRLQLLLLQFKVNTTGLRLHPIFWPSISPAFPEANHVPLLSEIMPRWEHLTLNSTCDKNLYSLRFNFKRATSKVNIPQDQGFPLFLSSKIITLLSRCALLHYIVNGQIRVSSPPSQQQDIQEPQT